nr:uncharacterized protein LOC109148764 isoform X2 [Ipomoea batatas]
MGRKKAIAKKPSKDVPIRQGSGHLHFTAKDVHDHYELYVTKSIFQPYVIHFDALTEFGIRDEVAERKFLLVDFREDIYANLLLEQPRPSSQHTDKASSQTIPESQPIPDSAPENPFDEFQVGNELVYNDEMHSINMPGETENAFVEFEVGNDEIHRLNLPDESDNPLVEFEVGNDEMHNINLPKNLENPSHEKKQVRKEVREERAIQQPPTSKKQKTLGLKRQVKAKHVATRTYRTRSTVGFKSKFKGNFNEPIELE